MALLKSYRTEYSMGKKGGFARVTQHGRQLLTYLISLNKIQLILFSLKTIRLMLMSMRIIRVMSRVKRKRMMMRQIRMKRMSRM